MLPPFANSAVTYCVDGTAKVAACTYYSDSSSSIRRSTGADSARANTILVIRCTFLFRMKSQILALGHLLIHVLLRRLARLRLALLLLVLVLLLVRHVQLLLSCPEATREL